MHLGCTFSNDKLYALKRHFEGTIARKSHTAEDWERSVGAGDGTTERPTPPSYIAVPDNKHQQDTTVSKSVPAIADVPMKSVDGASAEEGGASGHENGGASADKGGVSADKGGASSIIVEAIVNPDVVPEAAPVAAGSPGGLSEADVARVVEGLAKHLLADSDVRHQFVQTLAIEAAAYPHSAFCREPDALVRNMDGGLKLWRATMANDTGSGLVELLIKKHVSLFKNVKPSYDDDHVSVYMGGKVWVSVSHDEAAVSMLARAEHDMLSLYDAHITSPDTSYKNYRSQMQRFLTAVGCKLGWDHTPYEIDPGSVYDKTFHDSVLRAVVFSLKQTLSF